jgi:hypothetical protein
MDLNDGGMVTTSVDMLTFIGAFYCGKLSPKDYIFRLQQWKRIFLPMEAVVGIQPGTIF